MVESLPADAGDAGSCPGPGRSYMPWSSWAREPWPLSLRVQSLCSTAGEATTVRGPCDTHTQRKKFSPDGYLDYSCLVLQRNNCRSYKGHNIMTDFPSLLAPEAEPAMVYCLLTTLRLALPGLVQ